MTNQRPWAREAAEKIWGELGYYIDAHDIERRGSSSESEISELAAIIERHAPKSEGKYLPSNWAMFQTRGIAAWHGPQFTIKNEKAIKDKYPDAEYVPLYIKEGK